MGDELKPPFPPASPALFKKCGQCGATVNIHAPAPNTDRCDELVRLKDILREWGMEETDAKHFSLRIVYGYSGVLTTLFDPRNRQSGQ